MKRRIIFKILNWILVSFLLLVFMGVPLLAILENWRGKRAWEQCKRDLEAQGEHLDTALFIPPPVFEGENFAMTPLLKPLLDYTRDPNTQKEIYKDPNPPIKKISVYIDSSKVIRPGGKNSWRTDDDIDLQAWQTYYQAALPHMTHPESPAGDVLAVLGQFDGMFAELREAANTRLLSRFPVKYEEGFRAPMPHYSVLQDLERTIALHASAELGLNRPDDAFVDIQFGFRFIDSIRNEPFFVSGMVRASMVNLLMRPVRAGIVSHRWSEDQLIRLESQFQRWDFLVDCVQSVRAERAIFDETFARLAESQDLIGTFLQIAKAGEAKPAPFLKGWYYQNMAVESLRSQEIILAVNSKKQIVDVGQLNHTEDHIQSLGHSPYTLYALLGLPTLSPVRLAARTQCYLDEAIIACEIERYRLTHGTLPAKLDDLRMANLPHDVINGQPLHYRVIGDDNYILYSVGWNGTDDGGKVVKESSGRIDMKQGDWVWSLKPL